MFPCLVSLLGLGGGGIDYETMNYDHKKRKKGTKKEKGGGGWGGGQDSPPQQKPAAPTAETPLLFTASITGFASSNALS